MKRALIYISFALQFAATLLLLSLVCVPLNELPPGEVSKQWWWLARTGVVYAVFIGLSFLLYPRGRSFNYSLMVAWALIILGGWEAIIGLRQIYGFSYSNHSLFNLTGTFFNPGPYSGYLAMIFPVCLGEYLRLKPAMACSIPAKVGHYAALLVLLLIACVLPAGMSRSAWLAAGVSGLFVAWKYCGWGKKLHALWHTHKKKIVLGLLSGGICLTIALVAIFYLKKDSANGRLFMWRMELRAISDRPFTGHGINSFPAAYGHAQETYFAAGEYAEWEEHVAGSPEYAFNEYLQIAIEWGVPALLLCLAIVGCCFWRGLKAGRIGVCGGILSLAIFSFSSYPLQLPVFIVSLFVLLVACIVGESRLRLLLFSFLVGVWGMFMWKNNEYEACKKWTKGRMLYNANAFQSARAEYEALYPMLNDRREFMFEYGRCLNKLEDYEASNRILQETSLLSCDPMIFNVMGRNCQAMGNYEEAEQYFLRSVNRLPGRIYPYYLLAKLYSEPNFLQPDKFEYAARMVMEKEPKVQSTAIREMREEVKEVQKNFPPPVSRIATP